MPPSIEILEERLAKFINNNQEDIKERVIKDKQEIDLLLQKGYFDKTDIIIN